MPKRLAVGLLSPCGGDMDVVAVVDAEVDAYIDEGVLCKRGSKQRRW
jgi:hypothetical protein